MTANADELAPSPVVQPERRRTGRIALLTGVLLLPVAFLLDSAPLGVVAGLDLVVVCGFCLVRAVCAMPGAFGARRRQRAVEAISAQLPSLVEPAPLPPRRVVLHSSRGTASPLRCRAVPRDRNASTPRQSRRGRSRRRGDRTPETRAGYHTTSLRRSHTIPPEP